MLNIGAFCCLHTIDGVRVPSPALLALACADVDAVASAAAVTEIAGVEEVPIDTVAEAAAEAAQEELSQARATTSGDEEA